MHVQGSRVEMLVEVCGVHIQHISGSREDGQQRAHTLQPGVEPQLWVAEQGGQYGHQVRVIFHVDNMCKPNESKCMRMVARDIDII